MPLPELAPVPASDLVYSAIVQKMNGLWARNDALTRQQHEAVRARNRLLVDYLSCEIAGNIMHVNGLGDLLDIHGLKAPVKETTP
jgi:hypothetical protein